MLSYEEARRKVIEQVEKRSGARRVERVRVWDALGRILAQEVKADRAYPPFDRSTRDGYAVRAEEARPGVTLRCVDEIKAGDAVRDILEPGTCVQIMTGAAMPPGSSAWREQARTWFRVAPRAPPGRRFCVLECEWVTRRWPWQRMWARRICSASQSRVWPFFPPAMKWWRSAKPPGNFRFGTAIAFPWRPKHGWLAASRCSSGTPRIAPRNCKPR